MIAPVLIVGGLGCLSALGLGLASLKFRVEVDPRVEALEGVLPGANCGACGYAGCSALAKALAEGAAPPNACTPGGAEVAGAVAGILGVEAGETVQRVAVVHCRGGRGVAADKGVYVGVPDCRAAVLVGGGPKLCSAGCLGMGTCERVCPFDAIHLDATGLPRVDPGRCTGCGTCVDACPKRIIDLEPDGCRVHVRCRNTGRGKAVKAVCSEGCIGCGRCAKACPVDAIAMDRGLAKIDPDACVSCGRCAAVCPTGNIDDLVVGRCKARIDPDACVGCGRCAKACPVDAIAGEPKAPHRVDPDACIGCGRCAAVCPTDAVRDGDPIPAPGEAAA